eukprot:5540966-Amphidinium_carterae.1
MLVELGVGLQASLSQGESLPLVVLGKSWGGGVATQCAASHPDRVQKLVVVAPAAQPVDIEAVRCPVLLQWCRLFTDATPIPLHPTR